MDPAMTSLADLAREHYGLSGELKPLVGERDRNARLREPDGRCWTLKLAPVEDPFEVLEAQAAALELLQQRTPDLAVPRLRRSLAGQAVVRVDFEGEERCLRVLSWLEGTPWAEAKVRPAARSVGEFLGTLDRALADFEAAGLERSFDWDPRHGMELVRAHHTALPEPARGVVTRAWEASQGTLAELGPRLRRGAIHGDGNDHNLLVEGRRITGLIDFGDLMHTWLLAEPAIAGAYMAMEAAAPLETLAELLAGYHSESPVPEEELPAFLALVRMRLCISLTRAARALEQEPENEYLQVSVQPALDLLARLEPVDEGAALACLRHAMQSRLSFPIDVPQLDAAQLRQRRQRSLGPSLSLSYDRPLTILRGRGTYLFDETGRPFLDCVNNVCHVGHSHPRVVEAAARQWSELNTNTRYLHPRLIEYAERLAATLPEGLDVVTLVCSGSEANELALRMARAATGQRDLVVLEGGYHGNTQVLVDASSYKYDGPGGGGRAAHIHAALLPDAYRGPYRDRATAGALYARSVEETCARITEQGRQPSAFLVEAWPGCGGQIVPPPGYLEAAYTAVRAAGGVCIADEVQTGFGRPGTDFWAFQTQDVVPDIVTVGKPAGNGHPLAAVITTRAVADAFHNGMEYFNTFGGNPVSCAVGLAVLDIIEEEGLQANARRTGALLLEGLRDLATRHEAIGDVRGGGLYLGAELVIDRDARTPDAARASAVIQTLREEGILLSTDGPDHNVLKIKPPIVFGMREAERLLSALERALAQPHQG